MRREKDEAPHLQGKGQSMQNIQTTLSNRNRNAPGTSDLELNKAGPFHSIDTTDAGKKPPASHSLASDTPPASSHRAHTQAQDLELPKGNSIHSIQKAGIGARKIPLDPNSLASDTPPVQSHSAYTQARCRQTSEKGTYTRTDTHNAHTQTSIHTDTHEHKTWTNMTGTCSTPLINQSLQETQHTPSPIKLESQPLTETSNSNLPPLNPLCPGIFERFYLPKCYSRQVKSRIEFG